MGQCGEVNLFGSHSGSVSSQGLRRPNCLEEAAHPGPARLPYSTPTLWECDPPPSQHHQPNTQSTAHLLLMANWFYATVGH